MSARLLDLFYLLAALLYLPILAYQQVVLKKNRRGWAERFGRVPVRTGRSPRGVAVRDRPCIWIHAVSLGETNAAKSLVQEIEARIPQCEIVFSATTDTGYAAAQRLYGSRTVFRCPLDFSFCVRRALDRLRPSLIVLMELEAWPNLVGMASERGIPVCIVNGRVTGERSMRRFRLPVIRGVARRMFGRITWVGAQDDVYASRFIELGVPADRVSVTASLKYDTAVIADDVDGAAELAAEMGIDRSRPLIVAGSTGPGEEGLIIDAAVRLSAHRPDVQWAIIPRKPERFDEVARHIEAGGHRLRRRSRCRSHGDTAPGGNPAGLLFFLGDTMGELRKFYALSTIVFVGRTLVSLGGSDLMEAAGLGKPILHGPHVENFADVAARLHDANAAIQISGSHELCPAIERLLAAPSDAADMGRRAQQVVCDNRGATGRTVDMLERVLSDRTAVRNTDQ